MIPGFIVVTEMSGVKTRLNITGIKVYQEVPLEAREKLFKDSGTLLTSDMGVPTGISLDGSNRALVVTEDASTIDRKIKEASYVRGY